MGYQVFSLTMVHFYIYFSTRTTLDLSVQLTTVFNTPGTAQGGPETAQGGPGGRD